MTTAAKKQPSEWISKEEAATILGVNQRQVERRAQMGFIERRYLPRKMHERAARVQYLRADVDAILCGKPNHCETAVVVNAAAQNKSLAVMPAPQQGAVAQTDFFAGLAAHLTKLSAAFPSPPKEWSGFLTFEEAIEYSGHTPAKLEELLRSDQIDNYGRGPKTWRVRRASLDAYGEAGA